MDSSKTPTTPFTTARTLALAPGWWILPSILGGLYLWYRIIAACFG
ncbi:hypothetical protein [Pseudotabrizicola sp. 4114]